LSSDSGRTQQIETVTEGTALGARATTARAIVTQRRHLPDVQRAQRAPVVLGLTGVLSLGLLGALACTGDGGSGQGGDAKGDDGVEAGAGQQGDVEPVTLSAAAVVRAVDERRIVVVDIAPRGTEPRGR
jgi:hypothetical protein